MAQLPTIDWSVFDKDPECTVYCRCSDWPGFAFQSHAKHVNIEGKWVNVSRKPCPKCGATSGFYGTRSDWESVTLTSNGPA